MVTESCLNSVPIQTIDIFRILFQTLKIWMLNLTVPFQAGKLVASPSSLIRWIVRNECLEEKQLLIANTQGNKMFCTLSGELWQHLIQETFSLLILDQYVSTGIISNQIIMGLLARCNIRKSVYQVNGTRRIDWFSSDSWQ